MRHRITTVLSSLLLLVAQILAYPGAPVRRFTDDGLVMGIAVFDGITTITPVFSAAHNWNPPKHYSSTTVVEVIPRAVDVEATAGTGEALATAPLRRYNGGLETGTVVVDGTQTVTLVYSNTPSSAVGVANAASAPTAPFSSTAFIFVTSILTNDAAGDGYAMTATSDTASPTTLVISIVPTPTPTEIAVPIPIATPMTTTSLQSTAAAPPGTPPAASMIGAETPSVKSPPLQGPPFQSTTSFPNITAPPAQPSILASSSAAGFTGNFTTTVTCLSSNSTSSGTLHEQGITILVQDGIAANCTDFVLVKPGNFCILIAQNSNVSLVDFLVWNPGAGADCSELRANLWACVGVGEVAVLDGTAGGSAAARLRKRRRLFGL
jgi:hypothetical protein